MFLLLFLIDRVAEPTRERSYRFCVISATRRRRSRHAEKIVVVHFGSLKSVTYYINKLPTIRNASHSHGAGDGAGDGDGDGYAPDAIPF